MKTPEVEDELVEIGPGELRRAADEREQLLVRVGLAEEIGTAAGEDLVRGLAPVPVGHVVAKAGEDDAVHVGRL